MFRLLAAASVCAMACACLSGCAIGRESKKATYNVQKEADNFNVERRLSVINMRSDKPILELIGYFSISNNAENELVVTSEVGDRTYKVDYVYLNDWTMYTVEDISGADVDPYHYEINFLPDVIVPYKVTTSD